MSNNESRSRDFPAIAVIGLSFTAGNENGDDSELSLVDEASRC